MKDPAFLFYSQDFYTGVATLTMEDRGKYITLLCLMHQQGRMSEETIRFLVGSVSDNLKNKFRIDENGLWFNERLEVEAEKRSIFTESRRVNGKMGGRPKEEKIPNGKPNAKHMVNHMEDENENYIYSRFYDFEIEKYKYNPNIINYEKYVKKVFGLFGVYGKMDKVLKIKNQLTFEQFQQIFKKSNANNIILLDLLESFDNYESKTYNPKTVYSSLNGWINNEIKRKK